MNDYARVLSPEARTQLERRIAEHERTSGAQMVIAIFPSLEGEELTDFSIRLAERWRVGQKSLENGVILLAFVRERRLRLEVGYGLEPVLPDAAAGQILRETLAPRLREQRWGDGLAAAVEAVYARIDTRSVPPPPPRFGVPAMSRTTLTLLAFVGVIGLMVAWQALSGRGRARRHGYTAGGRQDWDSPSVVVPPIWWGGFGGGGRRGGGGDAGGFTPGGGSFGGGGASGEW